MYSHATSEAEIEMIRRTKLHRIAQHVVPPTHTINPRQLT